MRKGKHGEEVGKYPAFQRQRKTGRIAVSRGNFLAGFDPVVTATEAGPSQPASAATFLILIVNAVISIGEFPNFARARWKTSDSDMEEV